MKIAINPHWGLLLFGLAFPCKAAVIHQPQRNFISPQAGRVVVSDHTLDLRRLDFDLNNDGRVDIGFAVDIWDTFRITGPSTTRYLHNDELRRFGPEVIQEGYEIGFLPEASSFRWISIGESSGVMTTALNTPSGVLFNGKWSFKTGYLAVQFEADDGDHFAYLHIDSRGIGQFHIEQAWESEPNQPITAGAIPEPSSVLLLMIAPLSMFIRRRER